MTRSFRPLAMQRPEPVLFRHVGLVALIVAGAAASLTARLSADEPLVTYERDVRPILKTHCFHCHGEGGRKEGGLDLRLRRLVLAGGESGAVVTPGLPEESYLLERVVDGEMPPEEVELRPSASEIDILRRWIAQGAKTARPEPTDLDPDDYLTEEERRYWAFQPVERPELPRVRHDEQVRTPVDRFILARLEAQGLMLSPPADRRTLIRRLTFDLHGLPPTPEEVEAFVRDQRPDAYERLVERLLASPRYGERWGRHWLDVVGYADSEGYTESDPQRPFAYKYRDYVIASFNADKPFDQFIVEQLAGDELVGLPLENLSPQQASLLAATGFLRMAPDGTGAAGVDAVVARNDVMAATLEIVSSALLGLTVGCARCHDHRYDPISQKDYYALRAIFEPALDPRHWLPPARRRISLYTDADRRKAAEIEKKAKAILEERTRKQKAFIQAVFERELAKLPESVRAAVRKAHDTPPKKRTPQQKALLRKYPSVNVTAGSLYLYDRKAADTLKKLAEKAAAIRAAKPKEEWIRCVWEKGGEDLPETHVFARGDPEQPKEAVAPRALRILCGKHQPVIPVNDAARPTSGRRLAYARWLTSGRHPLVARVIVNRVWMWHFDRPIVPTPGDFGRLGTPPTHPQLLDWLADEFVRQGWSLKRLHRIIVSSAVYRQRSATSEAGLRVDAANQGWWHWPLKRLDAESFRDALLAVSGELNFKAGGPPVPVMADRIGQWVIGKENLNAGRPGPVIDLGGEPYRRTVFVEFRRSRRLSVLAPFDLPRMAPNCSSRTRSTAAPQALLLMNGSFVHDRARQMARRVRREAGSSVDAQIRRVWMLAYGRPPTNEEQTDAKDYLMKQESAFAQHFQAKLKSSGKSKKNKKVPVPSPALEALGSLCHAVLSSNEFLYVE